VASATLLTTPRRRLLLRRGLAAGRPATCTAATGKAATGAGDAARVAAGSAQTAKHDRHERRLASQHSSQTYLRQEPHRAMPPMNLA